MASQTKIAPVPTKKRAYDLALQVIELQEQIKELEARKDGLKKQVIAEVGGETVILRDLLIQRKIRKGSVDYGRVPQLAGVDLEPFRKTDVEYFEIGRVK